jgi:heme-degrading monooxygenase HmoA
MYARLIQLVFNENVTPDQAHQLYQNLIAEFRGVPGFRGCSLMLMNNARRGLTITYWDDADCASRAGERVLPTMIEQAPDLSTEPPEITGYEVIDHQFVSLPVV